MEKTKIKTDISKFNKNGFLIYDILKNGDIVESIEVEG